jgi:hypothetical protein
MVSGIRRGDGGGIEYWMARGGRGRGKVSWVMKREISDVSSVLYHSGRESAERFLHLSATVSWVFEEYQKRAEVMR